MLVISNYIQPLLLLLETPFDLLVNFRFGQVLMTHFKIFSPQIRLRLVASSKDRENCISNAK